LDPSVSIRKEDYEENTILRNVGTITLVFHFTGTQIFVLVLLSPTPAVTARQDIRETGGTFWKSLFLYDIS